MRSAWILALLVAACGGNDADGDGGPPPPFTSGVSTVGVGLKHTCAIDVDSQLLCWGDNQFGQLGDGTTTNRRQPTPVAVTTAHSHVSVGGMHTCAIDSAGELRCWGNNQFAQLGVPPVADRPTPMPIPSPGPWTAVLSGVEFNLAHHDNLSFWAWGNNASGSLGIGEDIAWSPPVEQPIHDWRVLDVGGAHACGIRAEGSLWCWGRNFDGEVGTGGGTQDIDVPARVGEDTDWVSVGLGGSHSCAIKSNGTLWCWGYNGFAQIGNGVDPATTPPLQLYERRPVQIGTDDDWSFVTGGSYYSCGIRTDHSLWCWGDNAEGQLGVVTSPVVVTPMQIGTRTDWQWIGAGLSHACGLTSDGALSCWGRNVEGQLGDGTDTTSSGPVTVPLVVLRD